MTKPDIFEISPVDFEFGNVVTHGTKEVVSKLRILVDLNHLWATLGRCLAKNEMFN